MAGAGVRLGMESQAGYVVPVCWVFSRAFNLLVVRPRVEYWIVVWSGKGGADGALALVELELGYVPPVGGGKRGAGSTNPRLGPREPACTPWWRPSGLRSTRSTSGYLNDLSGSLEPSD